MWHAPAAATGAGMVVPDGHEGKGAGQALSQMTGKVPSSHVSPSDVQFAHKAPFDPHSVFVVPAWQLLEASQQPSHTSLQGQDAPPVTPRPVWQLPPPSQHPLGQVAGPHAKPPHASSRQKLGAGQLMHWVPPNPQSEFVVPSWHTLLASQQPSQLSGLHGVVTHAPPSHNWSKSHSAQNAPPLPQSKV